MTALTGILSPRLVFLQLRQNEREVASLLRHGLLDRLAEHRTLAFLVHSPEPPFVLDPPLLSAYMLDLGTEGRGKRRASDAC